MTVPSEPDISGDIQPSEEQAPEENAQPPGSESGQGSAPQEPDYSLASDFLQRVDEADRPTVEKYLKQWDAGVTRRFQELHGKYQPYEQLGDPEELSQAVQVMRLLDEQPQIIYNLLMEDVKNGAEWAKALDAAVEQQNTEGAPPTEQQLQGLPPEYAERFDRNEQILQQIASIVLEERRQITEQQEDHALDEYISGLKTEFGDFDEEYVLALMEKGVDGAEAVKQFQGLIQEQINRAQQAFANQPRAILSGNGLPPEQQQSIAKLDKKDVRSMVAELMSATNAQGQ